jgi:hypothetical protein
MGTFQAESGGVEIMGTTKLERSYHCHDDCLPQGCPGHIATFEYESVSDSLHFSNGKGQEIYMNPPEIEAFLSMMYVLGEARTEIESILNKVFCGMKVEEQPK